MPLNDIVNVVITRQTQTVTEAGFGIPMILGTNVRFTDLIRFYSSMDEVAVDFSPADPEYVAAQDIFSQVISPNQIAIGRRQVDDVNILVETAIPGEDYTFNVNGNDLIINATSNNVYSVVKLNQDLVPGNRIAVMVNGINVGTTTAIINFDIDFNTGNSIVPRVDGVDLTAIPYNVGGQATTIGLVASEIQAASAGGTATVTGARQITVVFGAAGNHSVNSITTTGGTPPVATIDQGGFVYAGSSEDTMNVIAQAILSQSNIDYSQTSGTNGRTLTVVGNPGYNATVNSFVVTGGASQPTATITTAPQPVTQAQVATQIVTAINNAAAQDLTFPITAATTGNGIVNITNREPGTAYSLKTSTTIRNPNSAQVRITQVSPNQAYTITLNGIPYTYVSGNLVQTSDEIVQGLITEINRAPQQVDVTAEDLGNGSLNIEANGVVSTFSLSVTPDIMESQIGLIQQPLVAVNPVADDLTVINNANNTWYALIATDRTQATVKAIADWVETRVKLFGTASSNPDIIDIQAGTDTTSIAAVLNQAGYVRTFVMYHQDADFDYPEAAWFGRVLPLEPGSETWKFKTLNTISYSNLTTTQSNNALNKRANVYEFIAGVGITENGTVAQGEYIDIVRGIDWLTARIQEFVFSTLVNVPKVPYTNAGIAVIQAQVLRALELGISNQFISDDPAPIVTVPLAEDVPPVDKANRILRNVRFQATLSGAIHAVVIRGNLSV